MAIDTPPACRDGFTRAFGTKSGEGQACIIGHGRLRERLAPFRGLLWSSLRVRTVRPCTGVTA